MDTQALLARSRQEMQLLCAAAAQQHSRVLPDDGIGPHGLARVLVDMELVVDPRDLSIAKHLLQVGHWEWWVSKAISDVVRPGAVCVDVGANFGYFTALFMGMGASKVLAIEPQAALAQRLRASARINGWTQVEVVQIAVTDRSGRADLNVPSVDNLGGSSLLASGGDITEGDVRTVALDDILRVQPPPDVIKIDAEGAEILIWDGMQQTLQRNPGVHMFIEMTINPAAEAWLDRLEAEGYHLRYVAYDGTTPSFDRAAMHDEPLWMLYLHRD